MKKLFLLFLCIFTTDSFASGIASNTASAPCTNNTLETYSGNSNLMADWQPNTIQLKWYNNNTLLDVQSSANTCVYDGTLTIPQNAPTRTGYTFAGWTVQPEYDFSTLPTNEAGTESYGVGKTGHRVCYNETDSVAEAGDCHAQNFSGGFDGLDKGEWKTVFSWGTLYGMSMCSSTSGSNGDIENPVESYDYPNCWCKVTGYVPHGTNIKYAPVSANWAFNTYAVSFINGANLCPSVCSGRCALYITSLAFNENTLKRLLGVQ